eukprot:CAMPEP_0169134592 /NCGR_PEP_ID=MMETSP1015-20121227/39968_1 /TAXON_ID=342587 /ORGANISM="Karlodinium micrum, Strain CCMP2283" /LENGTH=80 /DNA_ID=CAMNT_0009199141 /DNA_START=170 /DNA_END=412 /DNA_ORIENTATION=-
MASIKIKFVASGASSTPAQLLLLEPQATAVVDEQSEAIVASIESPPSSYLQQPASFTHDVNKEQPDNTVQLSPASLSQQP